MLLIFYLDFNPGYANSEAGLHMKLTAASKGRSHVKMIIGLEKKHIITLPEEKKWPSTKDLHVTTVKAELTRASRQLEKIKLQP